MGAPELSAAPMIERNTDELKSYVQTKRNSAKELVEECQGNLAKLPQGHKARQDLGSQFSQLNNELMRINPNIPKDGDAEKIGNIEQQLAELSNNITLSLPIQ